MTREPIYAALFAKLAAAATFTTSSRRLKHWTDVPPAQQPALFQAQKNETADPQPPGLPTRWTLAVDVYLYANTSSAGPSPGEIMNPLLDAVVAALGPENQITNRQTLGGLVEHCWIEGAIETDEGVLGDQAVAIVPVRIFAV